MWGFQYEKDAFGPNGPGASVGGDGYLDYRLSKLQPNLARRRDGNATIAFDFADSCVHAVSDFDSLAGRDASADCDPSAFTHADPGRGQYHDEHE